MYNTLKSQWTRVQDSSIVVDGSNAEQKPTQHGAVATAATAVASPIAAATATTAVAAAAATVATVDRRKSVAAAPPKTPNAKPQKSARQASIDSSSPRLSTMERVRDMLADKMSSSNWLVRAFLAEFIGTFFLVMIGLSANIQQATTGSSPISAQIAWGFGFAFAVYLAFSVSGAHLNPAISIAATIVGDLRGSRLFAYILAQLAGAFVGTAAAWLGHYGLSGRRLVYGRPSGLIADDIAMLDQGARGVVGLNATAPLFATFPARHVSMLGAFIDQIVGTAILALCISLIGDKRNRIPACMAPLLAGLALSMITMTYGANAGFALNPARDLGPRLFLLCVGYGGDLFLAHNFYFYIPLIAPVLGAILGFLIYKLFIGVHGLHDECDITTTKLYPGESRQYAHSATSAGRDAPSSIAFRKMTVPAFPADDDEKLRIVRASFSRYRRDTSTPPPSLATLQWPPPPPPPTNSEQLEPHRWALEREASLRRVSQPSPPPPLPASQPPALTPPSSAGLDDGGGAGDGGAGGGGGGARSSAPMPQPRSRIADVRQQQARRRLSSSTSPFSWMKRERVKDERILTLGNEADRAPTAMTRKKPPAAVDAAAAVEPPSSTLPPPQPRSSATLFNELFASSAARRRIHTSATMPPPPPPPPPPQSPLQKQRLNSQRTNDDNEPLYERPSGASKNAPPANILNATRAKGHEITVRLDFHPEPNC